MNELISILLPPAVGLAGMRLVRWLLGADYEARHGLGLRFAVGLGAGMLVSTQIVLLGTLLGLKLAGAVAGISFAWGSFELLLLGRKGAGNLKLPRFQRAHLWLLLLLPVAFYFWVFGRLSVVEGAMEFDGVSHWLVKSRMMYFRTGIDFLALAQKPQLAYAHWDYPLLVPILYTLNYAAIGEANEFIVKVWPCWMMLALCLAVLSLADAWRRPHPLPLAAVLVFCLLPATMYYIHREGGTAAMVFYAGLSTLLIIRALLRNEAATLAAAMLMLAGCAMSKFEGMLYSAAWSCPLLAVCWKRGWFKNIALWRTLLVAVLCVVPYIAFRLQKPAPHPESAWPQVAIHSPGPALKRFPEILGVGLARRFFHKDFAHWTETPDGRLEWSGTWQGFQTASNYQLHILPSLTLLLLGIGMWQRRHWRTLLALTFVVFGVFAFVAFVMACLPDLFPQGTEGGYVLAKTGDDMSRYSYPFFAAWFLGIVSIWFGEGTVVPAPNGANESDRRIADAESLSRTAKVGKPALWTYSLILATAVARLGAQYTYAAHPTVQFGFEDDDRYYQLSVWMQDRCAGVLAKIKDPVEREKFHYGNAATARRLDQVLAPDARVFVSGLLGRERGSRSAMYFFLQNYLFPREIEISLDGKAVFTNGVFEGVPCDSEEILQARGFDMLVEVTSPTTFRPIPLSLKAVRR